MNALHVPDRAGDDDVDALHRDSATRTCVADDQEAARPVAPAAWLAFPSTSTVPTSCSPPGPCRHSPARAHRSPVPHARAVIADVAHDLDLEGGEAAGDGVRTVREDLPRGCSGSSPARSCRRWFQLPQRRRLEIDDGRGGSRRRRHGRAPSPTRRRPVGSGSRWASAAPGRTAIARYSDAIATSSS